MREHDLDHAIDATNNWAAGVDYRAERLIDRLELDLKDTKMHHDSFNAKRLDEIVNTLNRLAFKFELVRLKHTTRPEVGIIDPEVPF
jgi:hypothetical protein